MSAVLEDDLPDAAEIYGTAISPSTVYRGVFRNHWRRSIAATVPKAGELAEHIGAMGLAALTIERGLDHPKPGKRKPWQVQADWLEARIVPLLWQARYGADAQAVHQVAPFLGAWIAAKPRWPFRDEVGLPLIMPVFVARLLTEWINDRCDPCRGSGLQELLGKGGRRAPRLYGHAKVRVVSCQACWGHGRAQPDHRARAAHFSLPRRWYFELGWPKLFDLGHVWLLGLVGRGNQPLRAKLGKRRVAR